VKSEKPQLTWYCYGDRSEGKEGHPEHLNTGDMCTYPGCRLPGLLVEKSYLDRDNPEPKPKPSPKEDKPDKDKVLLAALSILNLGSGYTTMVGAAQIFPGLVGYMSGGIIQLVLFLLLSGSAAKHAPVRKWLTVAVFSFISVYTSFFAYYDQLTAKDEKEKGIQRALVARQQVRSELLAPLEDNVRQLEGDISQLKIILQREIDGNRGIPGNGPIAQKIRIQIEQKELELAKLKPNVEAFQNKFLSPKPGDSPQDIFQTTIQALESVPNEYRSLEYKGDLNKLRPIFFDEDRGIPILTPYRKVMKGEDSAIAAMLLAMGVDGLIIVLGTAVEKRKKIEVPIPLKGKASGFLQTFHNNINRTTGLINYENLIQDAEREGFHILLDSLRSSDLGWVEVRRDKNREEWYISQNTWDKFTKWYAEERQYQSEKEVQNLNNPQPFQSVKFVLPSRAGLFHSLKSFKNQGF
jgi:hypothetical protein